MPTTQRPLRLGTRASALALTQSGLVADALRALGWQVDLVPIRTDGDRLTGSLAQIGGTGVFVTALRTALLDGTCDIAVHSLKDLPTAPAPGIALAAVPEREDPRDVLCSRNGWTLADLPVGARVGTGSPRRAAQLRLARPDLEIVDIRGNVDTRLRRIRTADALDARSADDDARPADAPSAPGHLTGPLDAGPLDAVVLARAGLARLGRLDAVTEALDPSVLTPAPGQGALAIECRAADAPALTGPEALGALDHQPTRLAVTAERALLARLGAGCSAPVGALATPAGDGALVLRAVVVADDGTPVRAHARLERPTPEGAARLGERVAVDLLAHPALSEPALAHPALAHPALTEPGHGDPALGRPSATSPAPTSARRPHA